VKDLGLAIKIVVVPLITLAWLAFFGNLFYRSVTEGSELTATLSYGGAILFMLVWAVYQFIPKKKKNGAK
jgi:hypothetical protein